MSDSSFFLESGVFYPFNSSVGNIGGAGSTGQFTVWTSGNLVGSAGPASGALLDTLTGFSSTGILNRTGAGAYAFLGINVPNGVVQLTSASKLPILDGSLLTNLTSAALSGALPALNGAALTSLTAGNLLGALPAISGAALTSLPSLTGEVTSSGLAATINKAITPTWTGLHAFSVGLSITGVATWTATTAIDGAIANTNSFPKAAYFGGNTSGVYSSFTGAVDVLNTSTLVQANGLTGYARSNGTTTLAVGVQGIGLVGTDTGASNGAWGGNFVATNSPKTSVVTNTGFNFGNVSGVEVDVNILKRSGVAPSGSAQGLLINSLSETQPTTSYNAIQVNFAGTAPWHNGIQFQDASCDVAGVWIGSSSAGNGQPSMPITWSTRASGGGTVTGSLSLDVNGHHVFTGGVNTAGAYYIAGSSRLSDLSSTYTNITDPTGIGAISIGGGGDPTTYHNNTTHTFRLTVGTVLATVAATGLLPGADATYPLGSSSKKWTSVFAGTYLSGANQVVGARVTGYTAMTGTPDKATAFATSTVTLAQLAGRMMQLQADLTTHGLIGA